MRIAQTVLVTTIAVLAVSATPAGAAVAGGSALDSNDLVFSADPGEANRVTVSGNGGTIVIEDAGATISAGANCTNETPNRVRCGIGSIVSVDLGDGDDEGSADESLATLGDSVLLVSLDGGRGNDTLRGNSKENYLDGGLGRDQLIGGSGTVNIDAVEFARRPVPGEIPPLRPEQDVIDCAPALANANAGIRVDKTDQLDPECRRVTVYSEDEVVQTGTLSDDALGAAFGVPTKIYGLAGNDNINSSEFDRADGGEGNDFMTGFGLMLGGPGNDRLTAPSASESPRARMDGGPGNDFVAGGESNDSLTPGTGVDRVSGRGGNDTIRARDGERDVIRCGSGRDMVSADRVDSVSRDCERVSR